MIFNILLLLMIIGAIVAVEIEELLSSIVAVGFVGLCLSAAFLFLGAPDLAITQMVVEILCLIILIRSIGKRDHLIEKKEFRFLPLLVFALFLIVLIPIILKILKNVPSFGEPIMKVGKYYLENGFKETGAPNIISAVILDYRGYDTLGEATILFTAVIGVITVMRITGRKKKEEKDLE